MQNSNCKMGKLPLEMVNHILSFDKRFVIRNGKVIQIKTIPKNDMRYHLLSNIPLKECSSIENTMFVFLFVNEWKQYFILHSKHEIKIQVLLYNTDTHEHIIINSFTHTLT